MGVFTHSGRMMGIANTLEELCAVIKKRIGPFLGDCERGFNNDRECHYVLRRWCLRIHESYNTRRNVYL